MMGYWPGGMGLAMVLITLLPVAGIVVAALLVARGRPAPTVPVVRAQAEAPSARPSCTTRPARWPSSTDQSSLPRSPDV
jgi:hypothetical protein